jgi:single-stranded DNA-binding protein
MEIKGTIKVIKDIQEVSASFSKREFVIQTSENYPQTICLELHGDKVDIIDVYAIGESVIVSVGLRGREWINPSGEAKYFNTIVAYQIQRENSQPANNATTINSPQEFRQAAQPNSFADEPKENQKEEELDDDQLPF